ncbi:MAG TPA: MFS transporter [Anaerolineales bacterium]|nr:MFS transporter [Anaerolineales bacterium]
MPASPPRGRRLPSALRALQHPNYRLYFAGQLVSLTGTWMQATAQQWLVYRLTDSSLSVSALAFAQTLPTTLLSFYAGVQSDRRDRRQLLIVVQVVLMLLAFMLAGLAGTGLVAYWHVLVLALALGVANTFDFATRNALIGQLVDRPDLANAIALNSSAIQGARLVGPAISGLVVAQIGETWAFTFNALSFLAVIVALWLMRLEPRESAVKPDQNMWAALREGLSFLWGNPALRGIVLLVFVPSTVGFPLQVLLPELARERLNLGADGYGFLLALSGLGALAGAVGLALLGGYRRRGRLVAVAAVVFALAVLGLGVATDLVWVTVAMIVIGWAQVTHLAMSNTLLQDNVPDALRGRVLSAYIWVVVGFQPFGGLALGAVAEGQGLQAALWMSGGLCLAAAVLGLVVLPQVRRIP